MIDRATQRLDNQFDDTPLVEASIKLRLGQTFGTLGDSQKSATLLQDAMRIRREILGPEHEDTLQAMESYVDQFRPAPDSMQVIEELLATRQRILGDEHPDTLRTRSIHITTRFIFESQGFNKSLKPDRVDVHLNDVTHLS